VVVFLREVAEHRARELRVVGARVGDAVEGDDRLEGRKLRRGRERDGSAHAEPGDAHVTARARVFLEVPERARDVLDPLFPVERLDKLHGLGRVLRDFAVVQVGRERQEPGSGEAVDERADVVGDPPPLLNEDQRRRLAAAARGLGELSLDVLPVLRIEINACGHDER
jgi:hypothetical protein